MLFSLNKVPSVGKRAVSKLVAKPVALFDSNEMFYNMSHNTCSEFVRQE